MTVDLAWDVIKFLGGVIVGGASGYLLLARDVSAVKGKLEVIVGIFKLVQDVIKTQGELKAMTRKQKEDLNGYYARLRKIEKAIFADDEDEPPPISQM